MTVAATNRRRRTRAGSPENGGFSVNGRLTRNPDRGADQTGAMIRRMVRALSRRCECGEVEALYELHRLDQVVALETLRAVHALHVQHDQSWAAIGLVMGVSRQAAQQRWGS